MPDQIPPPAPPLAPAADEPELSPEVEFLLHTQELVESGKSAYGEIGSPRQLEKMKELDARLGLLRKIGEAPPPPEPWTEVRAARERLAQEFPGGDPAATRWHPSQQEFVAGKLAALENIDVRQQANLHQALVNDLADTTSQATFRYSMVKGGIGPTGSQILDQMLRDAEPAVHAHAPVDQHQATRDALKLDRGLLERFAVAGRNISAYQAAKARYGVN